MNFFGKDNFFMRIGLTGVLLVFGIFALLKDSKNQMLMASVVIISFLFLANLYLFIRKNQNKE